MANLPITDNIVLHFDANAIIGLNDDDLIAQWNDLSGLNNHAIQGTTGSKPTYKTNILDGKAVVRFPGGEKYLRHSSVLTDNYTAFYIIKLSESAVNAVYYYHAGDISDGDLGFLAETKNAGEGWGGVGNVPSTVVRTSDAYPTPLDWRIHTHQPVNIYKDGIEVSYRRSDNVYAGSLTDIGSRSDHASLYFVGDIAEIVVYSAVLLSADRALVEQYLGEKWLGWEPSGLINGYYMQDGTKEEKFGYYMNSIEEFGYYMNSLV